ncbi:hypothetical protein J1614_000699 [Plenodomus biglobosus]|nr:hypothetical protein J1614_000699 [Plenodomus biglobosus]
MYAHNVNPHSNNVETKPSARHAVHLRHCALTPIHILTYKPLPTPTLSLDSTLQTPHHQTTKSVSHQSKSAPLHIDIILHATIPSPTTAQLKPLTMATPPATSPPQSPCPSPSHPKSTLSTPPPPPPPSSSPPPSPLLSPPPSPQLPLQPRKPQTWPCHHCKTTNTSSPSAHPAKCACGHFWCWVCEEDDCGG